MAAAADGNVSPRRENPEDDLLQQSTENTSPSRKIKEKKELISYYDLKRLLDRQQDLEDNTEKKNLMNNYFNMYTDLRTSLWNPSPLNYIPSRDKLKTLWRPLTDLEKDAMTDHHLRVMTYLLALSKVESPKPLLDHQEAQQSKVTLERLLVYIRVLKEDKQLQEENNKLANYLKEIGPWLKEDYEKILTYLQDIYNEISKHRHLYDECIEFCVRMSSGRQTRKAQRYQEILQGNEPLTDQDYSDFQKDKAMEDKKKARRSKGKSTSPALPFQIPSAVQKEDSGQSTPTVAVSPAFTGRRSPTASSSSGKSDRTVSGEEMKSAEEPEQIGVQEEGGGAREGNDSVHTASFSTPRADVSHEVQDLSASLESVKLNESVGEEVEEVEVEQDEEDQADDERSSASGATAQRVESLSPEPEKPPLPEKGERTKSLDNPPQDFNERAVFYVSNLTEYSDKQLIHETFGPYVNVLSVGIHPHPFICTEYYVRWVNEDHSVNPQMPPYSLPHVGIIRLPDEKDVDFIFDNEPFYIRDHDVPLKLYRTEKEMYSQKGVERVRPARLSCQIHRPGFFVERSPGRKERGQQSEGDSRGTWALLAELIDDIYKRVHLTHTVPTRVKLANICNYFRLVTLNPQDEEGMNLYLSNEGTLQELTNALKNIYNTFFLTETEEATCFFETYHQVTLRPQDEVQLTIPELLRKIFQGIEGYDDLTQSQKIEIVVDYFVDDPRERVQREPHRDGTLASIAASMTADPMVASNFAQYMADRLYVEHESSSFLTADEESGNTSHFRENMDETVETDPHEGEESQPREDSEEETPAMSPRELSHIEEEEEEQIQNLTRTISPAGPQPCRENAFTLEGQDMPPETFDKFMSVKINPWRYPTVGHEEAAKAAPPQHREVTRVIAEDQLVSPRRPAPRPAIKGGRSPRPPTQLARSLEVPTGPAPDVLPSQPVARKRGEDQQAQFSNRSISQPVRQAKLKGTLRYLQGGVDAPIRPAQTSIFPGISRGISWPMSTIRAKVHPPRLKRQQAVVEERAMQELSSRPQLTVAKPFHSGVFSSSPSVAAGKSQREENITKASPAEPEQDTGHSQPEAPTPSSRAVSTGAHGTTADSANGQAEGEEEEERQESSSDIQHVMTITPSSAAPTLTQASLLTLRPCERSEQLSALARTLISPQGSSVSPTLATSGRAEAREAGEDGGQPQGAISRPRDRAEVSFQKKGVLRTNTQPTSVLSGTVITSREGASQALPVELDLVTPLPPIRTRPEDPSVRLAQPEPSVTSTIPKLTPEELAGLRALRSAMEGPPPGMEKMQRELDELRDTNVVLTQAVRDQTKHAVETHERLVKMIEDLQLRNEALREEAETKRREQEEEANNRRREQEEQAENMRRAREEEDRRRRIPPSQFVPLQQPVQLPLVYPDHRLFQTHLFPSLGQAPPPYTWSPPGGMQGMPTREATGPPSSRPDPPRPTVAQPGASEAGQRQDQEVKAAEKVPQSPVESSQDVAGTGKPPVTDTITVTGEKTSRDLSSPPVHGKGTTSKHSGLARETGQASLRRQEIRVEELAESLNTFQGYLDEIIMVDEESDTDKETLKNMLRDMDRTSGEIMEVSRRIMDDIRISLSQLREAGKSEAFLRMRSLEERMEDLERRCKRSNSIFRENHLRLTRALLNKTVGRNGVTSEDLKKLNLPEFTGAITPSDDSVYQFLETAESLLVRKGTARSVWGSLIKAALKGEALNTVNSKDRHTQDFDDIKAMLIEKYGDTHLLRTKYLRFHQDVGHITAVGVLDSRREINTMLEKLKKHSHLLKKAKLLFSHSVHETSMKQSYFFDVIEYLPADVRVNYFANPDSYDFDDLAKEFLRQASIVEKLQHLHVKDDKDKTRTKRKEVVDVALVATPVTKGRNDQCKYCRYLESQDDQRPLYDGHIVDLQKYDPIYGCPYYMDLTATERMQFFKNNSRCSHCLGEGGTGHDRRRCERTNQKNKDIRHACRNSKCGKTICTCLAHQSENASIIDTLGYLHGKAGTTANAMCMLTLNIKSANRVSFGQVVHDNRRGDITQPLAMEAPSVSSYDKVSQFLEDCVKEEAEPYELEDIEAGKGKEKELSAKTHSAPVQNVTKHGPLELSRSEIKDLTPPAKPKAMMMVANIPGKTRTLNVLFDTGASCNIAVKGVCTHELPGAYLGASQNIMGVGANSLEAEKVLVKLEKENGEVCAVECMELDKICTIPRADVNVTKVLEMIKEDARSNSEVQEATLRQCYGDIDLIIGMADMGLFPTLIHELQDGSGLGLYKNTLRAASAGSVYMLGGSARENKGRGANPVGVVSELLTSIRSDIWEGPAKGIYSQDSPLPVLCIIPQVNSPYDNCHICTPEEERMKEDPRVKLKEPEHCLFTGTMTEYLKCHTCGEIADQKEFIAFQEEMEAYDRDPEWELPVCTACGINIQEEVQHLKISAPAREDLLQIMDPQPSPILYRCEKCRDCKACKSLLQEEKIVSLRDERDDNIINQSLKYLPDEKCFEAGLGFKGDAQNLLEDNYEPALKHYHHNRKEALEKPPYKACVEKGFGKFKSKDNIHRLDSLPEDIRESIMKSKTKYYIPWSVVLTQQTDEKNPTTPARFVVDGSSKCGSRGKSLNDCLVRGSSRLNLQRMLTKFQMGAHALGCDLETFYNSIRLRPEHWKYQLILYSETWDITPDIYVIPVLTFGIKSSANLLERALDIILEQNPEATYLHKHLSARYVDDSNNSYNSQEEVDKVKEQMLEILPRYGFKVKYFAESYKPPPEKVAAGSGTVTVGGYVWNTLEDTISVKKPVLYFPIKGKGKKAVQVMAKASSVEEVDEFTPKNLTLRQCLSRGSSLYDPNLYLAPFITYIRAMISRSLVECKREYDKPVSEELRKIWVDIFYEMLNINWWTPRCPIKPGQVAVKSRLVVFADAGGMALCQAAYVASDLNDGTRVMQFLRARTQTGQVTGRVPRDEMQALSHAVDLARDIMLHVGEDIHQVKIYSDNRPVILQVVNDGLKLKLFNRVRVANIKHFLEQQGAILSWLVTSHNPADIPTKEREWGIYLDTDSPFLNPHKHIDAKFIFEDDFADPNVTITSEDLKKSPLAEEDQEALDMATMKEPVMIATEGKRENYGSAIARRLLFSNPLLNPMARSWPRTLLAGAMAMRFVQAAVLSMIKPDSSPEKKERWNKIAEKYKIQNVDQLGLEQANKLLMLVLSRYGPADENSKNEQDDEEMEVDEETVPSKVVIDVFFSSNMVKDKKRLRDLKVLIGRKLERTNRPFIHPHFSIPIARITTTSDIAEDIARIVEKLEPRFEFSSNYVRSHFTDLVLLPDRPTVSLLKEKEVDFCDWVKWCLRKKLPEGNHKISVTGVSRGSLHFCVGKVNVRPSLKEPLWEYVRFRDFDFKCKFEGRGKARGRRKRVCEPSVSDRELNEAVSNLSDAPGSTIEKLSQSLCDMAMESNLGEMKMEVDGEEVCVAQAEENNNNVDPLIKIFHSLANLDVCKKLFIKYMLTMATKECEHFYTDKYIRDHTFKSGPIRYSKVRWLQGNQLTTFINGVREVLDLDINSAAPVIDGRSPMAYAIIKHVHENVTKHAGADITRHCINKGVMILKGMETIQKIIAECLYCRRKNKMAIQQRMGTLDNSHLYFSSCFSLTFLDLSGPYTVRMAKRRDVRGRSMTTKVHVLHFSCSMSKLSHAIVCEGQDTQALIVALNSFTSIFGVPNVIMMDNHTSQVKSLKEGVFEVLDSDIKVYNKTGIHLKLSGSGAASHNRVGRIERAIGLFKRKLEDEHVHLSELTLLEFQGVCHQICALLNSFPLATNARFDHTYSSKFVTPLHYWLGRNGVQGIPVDITRLNPPEGYQELEKVRNITTGMKDFFCQHMGDLLLRPRFTQDSPWQPKVGSVGLIQTLQSSPLKPVYTMARIEKLIPDPDGVSRKIEVTYTNPGEIIYGTHPDDNTPVNHVMRKRVLCSKLFHPIYDISDKRLDRDVMEVYDRLKRETSCHSPAHYSNFCVKDIRV